MRESGSGPRRWAAILLLAIACAGSGAHFLHHLTDRDCDADGRHGSVPCAACSVLHGGAIAPQTDLSAPRTPSVIARVAIPGTDQPTTRPCVDGTPRAPPAV